MKPIVNVDVPMSKTMLNALTLFETYCVAKGIYEVSKESVIDFLKNKFNASLASQFESKYLY
jgi:hypothetical protein